MRRPENVWPSYVCLSSLFPTVCLCVFTLSNCVFVCLSLLGIVFLPNAALYWLCEFLSRNRPNSGREFRSLREIMGQSEEIYGAHIEKRLKYRERKITGRENTSWIVEIIGQSGEMFGADICLQQLKELKKYWKQSETPTKNKKFKMY